METPSVAEYVAAGMDEKSAVAIRAALKAVEGIPTEALEEGAIHELQMACELGLEWMGMESVPGATCDQEEAAIAKVEAAIAKAKPEGSPTP